MTIKNLVNTWSLPDRTEDKHQFTLRLRYDHYAKLLALKELYKNRSVNDLINDILGASLDEVVEALPSYKIDREEAIELAMHFECPISDVENNKTGPRLDFDRIYKRILEDRSVDDSQEAA